MISAETADFPALQEDCGGAKCFAKQLLISCTILGPGYSMASKVIHRAFPCDHFAGL